MFDVITFGSATLDIFVKTPRLPLISKNHSRGIFVPLREKIEGANILSYFGGCGLNTAVSFKKQGLKVAFCGMVGNDIVGQAIEKHISKLGISSKLLFQTDKSSTNLSVILSKGVKDRTILIHRGASELLDLKNISYNDLQSKWFYLASLTGKALSSLDRIVSFSLKKGIKIALNPSKYQLISKRNQLKKIVSKINVLILNQEEASILTQKPLKDTEKIFNELLNLTREIVVMTRGPKGVYVSDHKFIYKSGILNTKVVDRTGAGDSFGSGFVTGLIRYHDDILSAIKFGLINSSNCLKKWGAQEGFVKIKQPYIKFKIRKEVIK